MVTSSDSATAPMHRMNVSISTDPQPRSCRTDCSIEHRILRWNITGPHLCATAAFDGSELSCIIDNKLRMQFHTIHKRGQPRVQSSLHLARVKRILLFDFPGHGCWHQQLYGSQPGNCVAVRAKDLEAYNSGWQLREAAPLQKPPVGTAVVVGAGVAGLISALGLAKFGMQVHVRDATSHAEFS